MVTTGRSSSANPPTAHPPTQPTQQPTQQLPLQVSQPLPQQAAPLPRQMQLPLEQAIPTAVTQPAVQSQGQAPAIQPATIQQLLRDFSKKPGCERYSADSDKIKLLEDYLWIRQLTPNLPFELFLSLYEPVADYDDQNLKRPADAIKAQLPRTKKVAEERGLHHWAAKEVVDYVALFVDMIREAETTQTPIPIAFNAFLTSAGMIEQFLAGAFKEAPQPRATTSKAPGVAKVKTSEKVRPSAVGQRVIYTVTGGRQHRGTLTSYWLDEHSGHYYADFQADDGEEFKGVGVGNMEICADNKPNPPQTLEGDTLPEIDCGHLKIPKAQYPSVLQALALSVPVGTVAIGDNVSRFTHQFKSGHTAVIDVVNGEAGPFVDARLCLNTPDNVIAECNPPRKNIDGMYTFETPEGVFTLQVSGNA